MTSSASLYGSNQEHLNTPGACSNKRLPKASAMTYACFGDIILLKTEYSIVLNGNWCKFSQNPSLRDFLLSTKDQVLVEASPYDAIWGIGLSADSPDAQNPHNWRGQNLLGFALMEVRDELRRVTQNESLCDWSTAEE